MPESHPLSPFPDEHPLLVVRTFVTDFPAPLADLSTPAEVLELLRSESTPRVSGNEEVRRDVRDLLRWGGYKPTGRGKPASEYLARAAEEGRLTTINPAVDVANAVSLHSRLPISVVDADLVRPPLRIAVASQGERYVFNRSAQEIEVGGLICLFDADGPCANPVRDAQRSKTGPRSRRTLSVVWGHRRLGEHLDATTLWYRELLHGLKASTGAI